MRNRMQRRGDAADDEYSYLNGQDSPFYQPPVDGGTGADN